MINFTEKVLRNLLIDGINEVGEQTNNLLDGITSTFNIPGVIWICSGRGIYDIVENNINRWEKCEVLPMKPEEMRDLVEQELGLQRYFIYNYDFVNDNGVIKNLFLDTLLQKSRGLPLYITLAIRDIKSGRIKPETEINLPDSLYDYYEKLLIVENISDENQMLTDVMTLMSLVTEPVGEEEIIEILEPLYPKNCKKILERVLSRCNQFLIKSVTVERRQGWMIFHESLRNHLASTTLTENSRRKVTNSLIEWCSNWKTTKSPYALRNYIAHLESDKRYECIHEVVKNGEFLEVQFDLDPELPLHSLNSAVTCSIKQENPTLAANYLLKYSEQLNKNQIIENPIYNIRSNNIDRAIKLVNTMPANRKTLNLLIMIVELIRQEKYIDAKLLIEKIKDIEQPELNNCFEIKYAAFALAQISAIDKNECLELIKKLIPKTHIDYLIVSAIILKLHEFAILMLVRNSDNLSIQPDIISMIYDIDSGTMDLFIPFLVKEMRIAICQYEEMGKSGVLLVSKPPAPRRGNCDLLCKDVN